MDSSKNGETPISCPIHQDGSPTGCSITKCCCNELNSKPIEKFQGKRRLSITFRWGIGKKLDQMKPYHVYLAEDNRDLCEKYSGSEILRNISFHVFAPSKLDPDSAPVGKEAVVVKVSIGNWIEPNENGTHGFIDQVRDRVLQIFGDKLGISDLRGHIETEYVDFQKRQETMA